jgi:hypothetical protein
LGRSTFHFNKIWEFKKNRRRNFEDLTTLSKEKTFNIRYDIKKAKIIESGKLVIIAFDKIEFLESTVDKLEVMGYLPKPKHFHITLGDKDELIKFEYLYDLIQQSFRTNLLVNELKDYLLNQDWTFIISQKKAIK